MEYPLGFKFAPSDGEIIGFLKEKVSKGTSKCQMLRDCDMYGDKEPWQIWNDHGGLQTREGEDIYFFTKLKKVSANAKRISRRVGSGTWSGANCSEVVAGVGQMRHFRYENGGGRDHGAWIMHEYSLLPHHYPHADREYVLCRLRKKTSEARETKRLKLTNNNDVNINGEDQKHCHRQPTQDHRQETDIDSPTLALPNAEDDDTAKLMEYYMSIEEQEKWSLPAVDVQEAPVVDDVCDWGFLFADDDEDVAMGIGGEEFHHQDHHQDEGFSFDKFAEELEDELLGLEGDDARHVTTDGHHDQQAIIGMEGGYF